MADKSFALKVELQGDIDKFKANMDKASSQTKKFGNSAAKHSKKAGDKFKGLSGNVNKLTGSISSLSGNQGIGLLGQALSSIASPAGIATTALAAVGLAVRQAKQDMKEFETSLASFNVGYEAFWESGKDVRKAEKKEARGMWLANMRGWVDAIREGNAYEIMRHGAGMRGAKSYREEQGGLFFGGDRRESIKEYAKLTYDVEKATNDLILAKRDLAEIEEELKGQASILKDKNSTEAQKILAQANMRSLIAEWDKLMGAYDTAIEATEKFQAATRNTREDSAALTNLQKERTGYSNKEISFIDILNRRGVTKLETEEKTTEEKEKQLIIEQDLLQIARQRNEGLQVRAGANSGIISYAGAGVNMGGLTEEAMADMVAWNNQMKAFGDELNQNLVFYIEGSISSLFEGLGSAMAGADVDIGKELTRQMGGFMAQMGKMFIAFGISAGAFQKLLGNITNPAAAIGLIAAGAALVTIGSAIQTSAASYGQSSVSHGGSYASAGGGISGDNVVRFEITGDKLEGVLNNHNRKTSNYR